MSPAARPVPGMFTLVLHTHLPWLAHHGRWPVGEEWLYQSWAAAYLPLLPYVYEALDRVEAHLDGTGTLPADAVIATQPRAGKPLDARHLAIPR